MKPDLSCCEPKMVPFSGGWAWAHSRDCKVSRLQKVQPGEDHPSRWGRGRWWGPTPYKGPVIEALAWRAHHGRWGA